MLRLAVTSSTQPRLRRKRSRRPSLGLSCNLASRFNVGIKRDHFLATAGKSGSRSEDEQVHSWLFHHITAPHLRRTLPSVSQKCP
jgi:hypothetical protein